MSRSFKKHPVATNKASFKKEKQENNRKHRRKTKHSILESNGTDYKRDPLFATTFRRSRDWYGPLTYSASFDPQKEDEIKRFRQEFYQK